MYSKQESSLIRKEFWTSFGQYMRPIPNSEGKTINWLNYKTGMKNIYFRMDADKNSASIAIELHHTDSTIRHEVFEKLEQIRKILHDELGEEWNWNFITTDEHGKSISSIGTVLKDVSIFNKNDWPAIISFLKPRLIALDNFWNLVKEDFQ